MQSNISVEEMTAAGVQFGHKVSKLHPKMKPYVAGIKNNVHVFDLEKTATQLQKALDFISKLVAEGKTVMFVGTKIQLKHVVQNLAEETGMPYVTERWLGGIFTNFETIQKRVEHYKDLEAKKAKGELEKYTKKERALFDRELSILKTKFEGIKNMPKLPEAVFIFGIDKDLTCAKECKRKNIKIAALVDTNVNPDIVDYPVPANDDAIMAAQYIADRIKEAVKNAKAQSK